MTALEIFHNAPEDATPVELASYLEGACEGDAELRGRVEALFALSPPEDDFLSDIFLDKFESGSQSSANSGMWQPPSVRELQAMLPQYEISGILGRGGMGAVYRGRQRKLNRDVAIKILPESLTANNDKFGFAKRFLQEARSLAKLNHPAIISVYDFGETEDGQLFFVMEYVDGMDVREYLEFYGGKLSQSDVLSIVAHVLDALEYAHRHGIVHRDIKPANVLISAEGRVKIADFGVAKQMEQIANTALGEKHEELLTVTNVAVGTPYYAAPEATEVGKGVDQRADLYSVGVMLYQMLTGTLPKGSFKMPSVLLPNLDIRIDGVIRKSLQADPNDRFSSASEFRWELQPVITTLSPLLESDSDNEKVEIEIPPLLTPEPAEPPESTEAKKSLFENKRRFSRRRISPIKLAKLALAGGCILVVGLGVMFLSSLDYSSLTERLQSRFQANLDSVSESIAPEPAVQEIETDPSASETVAVVKPVPNVRKSEKSKDAANAPVMLLETSLPGKNDPEMVPLPAEVNALLDLYLNHRNQRVGKLASGFHRQVSRRLDDSVASGDLILARAYEFEKTQIESLRHSLQDHWENPLEAILSRPVMEDPEHQRPADLLEMLTVWDREEQKIYDDLDQVLARSLDDLQRRFTKEKKLDEGDQILQLRKNLFRGRPLFFSGTGSPLEHARRDDPFVNSLGMVFVPIPNTGVLFCIHETRWGDFEAFVRDSGADPEGRWEWQSHEGIALTEKVREHPVGNVTWNDAEQFCQWLSRRDGLNYRLPTDEEWSKAVGLDSLEVRGKYPYPENVIWVENEYPWGRSWPILEVRENYSDLSRMLKAGDVHARYLDDYEDAYPTTSPVMKFTPNQFGLFDMGGNVHEWVLDWWNQAEKDRTVRGGSFANWPTERNLLSSFRMFREPTHSDYAIGFRIVVELYP